MKVIDKRLMIERDKEEMIFNERMILSRVNHPKVIALHYAFQTVIEFKYAFRNKNCISFSIIVLEVNYFFI